jgi:glycosyltransferase involved in cell wall biosynthesis
MPEPLVFFSPLPPAKSGIADYMLELLPALAAQREVVVVCEQPQPGNTAWQAISPAQYHQDSALAACPHFYQIGNNKDHVFAYRAFRARPGILVQHDFNLHYLVEDATLVLEDVQGYRDIMVEEYGQPGGTLADLRQMGVFSESQKLTLGLNTHLLPHARGVIVHSRWVYERLPAAARPKACVVPHHFAPQALHYDNISRADARRRLGLPDDAVVLLSLGYITAPKQVQATLAALALLGAGAPPFVFVVGGERNGGFDIDAQVRAHGLQDKVRITGFLDEDAFFTHIVAADLLVNLRYPTVGESSGTLARALALGLPAVVHNFGSVSEFPNDVVLKVPLELDAPVKLAAALDSLMHNPERREALGQRAKAHMRRHCSVENSASAYLAAAAQAYGPRPMSLAA